MTKQTIEIDVPEGYVIHDHFTSAELDENDAGYAMNIYSVRLKKKPPRRRAFECVSEEPRQPEKGEWFEDVVDFKFCNVVDLYNGKYKIFKEVKE